jgi:pyruvate kinase
MPIRQVEPLGKVRTKIVATVGPSSRDPAVMRELIEAGVDVFRLNFSHGKQEEHTATLRSIRMVAEECGRIIAVLQDLGGPKIRVGPIPGDVVDCALGEVFTVVCDRTTDDPHQLTCTYRDLPKDLKAGDVVLFADGAVIMVATDCLNDTVKLKVTLPGRLKSNQGLNLPGAALNVKALTEKDLRDLDWSAWHRVEYIGLSFVRQAEDITWLRQELDRRGSRARIVAKIEKPQALDNLDAIIAQADVLMVARGDLGVEMDVAKVPAIQKKVIAACHKARVPVITATQMLNSMETSNRPTRAEATDVFNAVLDGTDAVMLSGETAVGQYPVEAVATMSQIVAEAESLMFAQPGTTWTIPTLAATATLSGSARAGSVQPITESVVEAASLVSRKLGAALLVAVTHSGRTALVVSKQRNATPTIALTDDAETARALALNWGVTPLYRPEVHDVPTALAATVDWARGQNLLATGDRVVVLRGTMPGNPTHNALTVHVVE